MKILISGGAGFIGSHLADILNSLGHLTFIVDDLSSGRFDNLNDWYKKKPYRDSRAYYGDVGEKIDMLLDIEDIEVVFHLAANTDVPLSVRDPLYDFKTLQASLKVIDACSKRRIPICYLSSSFVYGNGERPTKEVEPFSLTAPYGIVKNAVENYLEFYHRVYGLSYAIVRPSTVYGPRQIGGAMADYIRRLKKGEQGIIYGDKTRDYLYVSDLIDALVLLMNKDYGGVFNVGTGKETSLTDLYSKIANILGKENNPKLEEGRPAEIEKQCLDSSKLRKLGWEPKIGLEEGLRLTCS